MKTETIIWTVILVAAGGWIAFRASTQGMGKVYVKESPKEFVNVEVPPPIGSDSSAKPSMQWVEVKSDLAQELDLSDPTLQRIHWTKFENALPSDYYKAQKQNPNQTIYRFSTPRTIGVWIAAFFTLAIFSFLYKDNPFYKLAESIVIGVSAAYWMVVGFWDVIVPNLFGKLAPGVVKAWALPGLSGDDLNPDYFYLAPLILGIMLVWRLMPVGQWISRWPLAFIIGTTAGIRLVGFIHADFLSQIRNSIVPVVVMENGVFKPWDSLANLILVIGVLACLVYFFFSFEHKGLVGKTAKLGIWFLMITFGAAFGYTVMGRIALLAIRLEFLFDDWLWLIDPTDKRLVVSAATAMLGMG